MKPTWKKIYPPYLKDGTPISKAVELVNGEVSATNFLKGFVTIPPADPNFTMSVDELEMTFETPLDGTPQQNVRLFDKRTAKGYRLNLITGKYEK